VDGVVPAELTAAQEDLERKLADAITDKDLALAKLSAAETHSGNLTQQLEELKQRAVDAALGASAATEKLEQELLDVKEYHVSVGCVRQ